MTRDWKPGDVAQIAVGNGGAVGIWTGEFWAWSKGDGPFDGVSHCHRSVDARPLVVIDPEDREQLSEFAAALMDAGSGCEHGPRCPAIACLRLTVADALRGLIASPKPDEPTGLGAVVECTDGRRFVRTIGRDSPFPWVDADDPASNAYNWVTHGGLDGAIPVRILSDGVTP